MYPETTKNGWHWDGNFHCVDSLMHVLEHEAHPSCGQAALWPYRGASRLRHAIFTWVSRQGQNRRTALRFPMMLCHRSTGQLFSAFNTESAKSLPFLQNYTMNISKGGSWNTNIKHEFESISFDVEIGKDQILSLRELHINFSHSPLTPTLGNYLPALPMCAACSGSLKMHTLPQPAICTHLSLHPVLYLSL